MKKVVVLVGEHTIEFNCEKVELIKQFEGNIVLLLTRAFLKGIDAGNVFVPYERVVLWNM